ncbi:MAG: monovalent cation:proton antiporter-2 (CPA2) family protein [Pseudomonadales bacterium]
MNQLHTAIIFLAAAVIAVPVFKRLGLGAVLGYLAAGILIGPAAFGLIDDVDHILHFAELGVVLLLFIIGLELQPSRLWALRRNVFGWGSFQLLVSAALLTAAGLLLGVPLRAAIVVGFVLALSSTAFALQMLAERNELTTRHGRSAFAVLLFQDIAVVPLLAIVPLLGDAGASGDSAWLAFAKGVAVLLVVVFGGRIILRYGLRIIANTNVREILTATALLTALGTALLVEVGGLSMALGAFIAGMLLADSEFRHQLEADIEPFKGLLLGLFFMAVGMSVNIDLIAQKPLQVAGLAIGLVAIKALVIFVQGKLQGLSTTAAKNFALSIAQGGEFAFVILGIAVTALVIDSALADLLIVVVTLSMAVTPVLLTLNDWLARRATKPEADYETPVDEDNPVIIAGFGRFGQIIARILRARKIHFTALDISQEQVDFVSKYGNKIYYGDASRLDLLQAANAGTAKVFVLAVDDVEASLKIAEIVAQHFPQLKVYARARNRKHAYQLLDLGVKIIRRETFHSAVELAADVLQGAGLKSQAARQAADRFKQHDIDRLFASREHHTDEQKMLELAKSAAQELEELFVEDLVQDEKL